MLTAIQYQHATLHVHIPRTTRAVRGPLGLNKVTDIEMPPRWDSISGRRKLQTSFWPRSSYGVRVAALSALTTAADLRKPVPSSCRAAISKLNRTRRWRRTPVRGCSTKAARPPRFIACGLNGFLPPQRPIAETVRAPKPLPAILWITRSCSSAFRRLPPFH
jgi:hypothetical protein